MRLKAWEIERITISGFWLHSQQIESPRLQRSECRELLKGGVARMVANTAEVTTAGTEDLQQRVEAVHRETVWSDPLDLLPLG